VTHKNIAKFMQ